MGAWSDGEKNTFKPEIFHQFLVFKVWAAQKKFLKRKSYIFEISEGDKLDNVSGNSFSHGGPEHAVVSIQKLHGLKIGRPHPHDNDGQGQPRCSDDGVSGLIEICDLPVGEDEEDEVLLQNRTWRWR